MHLKFGLIATLLATIAAFWAWDVFLARVETRELQHEASSDAEQGERSLAAGRTEEAIDLLRKAHSLERDDSRYELGLAQALIAGARLNDAADMLSNALEQSPNDGEANLIEARLMARRGNLDQAEAYYHRAIYGIWPGNAEVQRIRVRLELANLLASIKSKQALLAELIPLDAEAQHDLAVRRQVAHLYVEAGSPARAVAAYQALIRDDPEDGENYAGLGEAELALGDYRAAEAAFQDAIQHGVAVEARLDLAVRLLDLDPTPRRLSIAEKFARSNRVLALARSELANCTSGDQAKLLLQAADALLSARNRGPITNEMSEDRLAEAQTIWEFRASACRPASAEETLSLLMSKLAQ